MARAIDAVRFGEIMEQWKKDCLADNETQSADIISDVILELDDMPTLTPPNEWVNAKDNPPQLTGKYICCVEDTHGYMWSIPADYLLEMKTWVGEFGEIKNKVVYWMPLPAPPEKEE